MPCAGMPRLALVSYPVLLFCTVLPPCFILLWCFFCRLVLFRCGAFLPPRFTLLRCLFLPPCFTSLQCLFCRLVLLRCGAFFAASFYFAAVPCLAALFYFAVVLCLAVLPCSDAPLHPAALICPVTTPALPPCLVASPYHLTFPRRLACPTVLPGFAVLPHFTTLPRPSSPHCACFFHLKKTIFRTLCPSPFPFCAVP